MTELEYKLMSVIGNSIDRMVDFSDDMDEFVCEVDDEQDCKKANGLADDVLGIITLLTDVFNKVVEENKEEWVSLLKAECKIIEKLYKKEL